MLQMANLTPGQIIDCLARGEENRLVGVEESDQVDFKLAPYALDAPHQKWELAKDVAAFANRRGGVIVIGVRTERRPNEIIEVAAEIRPVRKTLVDLQQHRGVVDGWIYPRPEAVDFRWYPPSAATELGLLLIDVPAQDETLLPFIVRDMRDPEGEFRGAVGIPRRDRDRIVWDSAQDLHRQIGRGRSGPVPPRDGGETLARAGRRITEAEQIRGWEQDAVYALQALPPQGPDTLDGFYDEVRENLRRYAPLRPHGFAWQLRELEAIEGGWVSRSADRLVWVDPDGVLTQVQAASPETNLGWYFNQSWQVGQPVRLHPVAVVETTLEFFRLLYGVLKSRVRPELWRYRVTCKRFRTANVWLAPGRPAPDFPPIGVGWAQASTDEWERVVRDTGDVRRDTFEALTSFYALFGHPPAAVPLVVDGGISEEQLAAIR